MNTSSAVEPLESRIAPASVLTYTDVDGDLVKVTSSLGDLNAPGVATKVAGIFMGEQLTMLTLTDASFQGTTIATSVAKAAGGDGLVHIGRIDATGRDLGSVTIKGDLAVIDCGDTDTKTVALKSLNVRSMGVFGTATQGGGDLVSDIKGTLGTLKVTGDLKGVRLQATSMTANEDARIGTISIGGSLIGDATDYSGGIFMFGTLSSLKIVGDIVGGFGTESGAIGVGDIKSAAIGGSLIGGDGADSGRIRTLFNGVGTMKIGGSIVGGTGEKSGRLDIDTAKSIVIGNSLIGGIGEESGSVQIDFNFGSLKIAHDVVGSSGLTSGSIQSAGPGGSITIGGSLVGGAGGESLPGAGEGGSGSIHVYYGLDLLKIGRDIVGGSGAESGRVHTVDIRPDATVDGAMKVGGSIIGGSGVHSGTIDVGKEAGPITVVGDLHGGAGPGSGAITDTVTTGVVDAVTIGGSVIGGAGGGSGTVFILGKLGPLKIGRDLIGGSIDGSASLDGTGFVRAGSIASVTIGGSVIAGTDSSTGTLLNSGSIRANNAIGAISIRGSVLGNESSGGLTKAIISARGQTVLAPGATTDLAIKSLTIGGRVSLAEVLAGFDSNDLDSAGSNGNASIGAVKVGGDWFASTMSAGVQDNGADGFGDGDEAVINNPAGAPGDTIIARIASITIKGVVIGAPNPFFQCAFTAQQIGSFKSFDYIAPLTAGTDPAINLTPYNVNMTLLEVP
jgi:hypothetical protein